MRIDNIDEFLTYYERIRNRTERVVEAIPLESFDWTYKTGKFTFADILRHVAALERFMFAENACGRPSLYPGYGPDLAASPREVLAFFRRMHEETVQILSALQPEDLQRRCTTPGGASLPVWKWLRAMVEHEIHHRGQIYIYLGILGRPSPPLYGLTSEQVFERSDGS